MNTVGKLSGKGYTIKLRFVGSVSSGNRDIIMSKAGSTEVEFIPYVNHAEAIRYMMGSSVLLLVIPDHHSNRSIITGKLFEYLASGKPILCIGPPDGDAAEIIESSGNGGCAGYDDTEKMNRLIEQFYKEGTGSVRQMPSAYSRESLTKKLTGLF
jgi:glycosyltransferase involved in cell wall biosynthesis